MWATEPHLEHEGIAGATFDSEGHRLVGSVYLARGVEPKPTALLLHGCPGLEKNLDLAVLLRDRGWNSLVFHYRGCWGSAGRYQMGIVTAAAIMGSHVRVGLEDSLYLGKGQIAESNASQVTKIRGILEALSLEVATPAEAREMLGLKGLDNVGY